MAEKEPKRIKPEHAGLAARTLIDIHDRQEQIDEKTISALAATRLALASVANNLRSMDIFPQRKASVMKKNTESYPMLEIGHNLTTGRSSFMGFQGELFTAPLISDGGIVDLDHREEVEDPYEHLALGSMALASAAEMIEKAIQDRAPQPTQPDPGPNGNNVVNIDSYRSSQR